MTEARKAAQPEDFDFLPRISESYATLRRYPRPPEQPISDVIPWSYAGNKLHPTQKPLCVLTPLVDAFCAPGGLVLDPFAGSGSTLVAARSLGRHYLGIERDAGYHAASLRRLNQSDTSTPPGAEDGL